MTFCRANIFLILTIALLSGCGNKTKNEKGEKPLATVGDKNLYRSEINPELIKKMENADSIASLKAFVDSWIEKQLVVSEAEKVLSEKEKDYSGLIEDYRSSLLLYAYQKKLVAEKLDTNVTSADIETYYKNNQNSFELKKNIVKIRYVKLNKERPDIKNVKKYMQNPSAINDSLLKNYAEKFADNFFIDNNWLYLDDIIKEIPLNAEYDKERFLNNNKYIQIEENGTLYMLYIIDFKVKNSTSPIEFERGKIREILLYTKKLDLLKQNQEKLMEEGLKHGFVKYYLN
ncbi:MAG: hypothetical protein H7321_03175 [Bacteroidia bacterium]|nr:hypothetical protein [Bacteroidia bacterium]